MSEAVRDQNRVAGLIAETNDSNRTPTPLIVDPITHRLLVNSLISGLVSISPLSTIYNGTKTVPTTTAEAIASAQATTSVTVKALSTNTVPVYVGKTGVTVANGFELLAGESISMDINDLSTVFVISGSSSQVIRYIAI
jgi:hypothetical protein